MELADRSLADAVTAGVIGKSADLFAVYKAVCAGVAHIHANGIIHRDLKPENILFIGGTPKVADLGLCLIAGLERVTSSLEAVGPRFYMAPELEDGRSLDVTPTADIYSLGKILYFMLSGGRIFSRESTTCRPGTSRLSIAILVTVYSNGSGATRSRHTRPTRGSRPPLETSADSPPKRRTSSAQSWPKAPRRFGSPNMARPSRTATSAESRR
jgi:serine/threonine protein kinase